MILRENGLSIQELLLEPWTSAEQTTKYHAIQQQQQNAEYSKGILSSSAAQNVSLPEEHMGPEENKPLKPAVPVPASSLSHPATQMESLLEVPLFGTLSPKDAVILVKTGATALWRRMPMHMSTTLSSSSLTPNIAIYSDSPSQILSHPIIDVLANISTALKPHSDFDLYHAALAVQDTNLYLESGSMEGDHYLPGGWRLDKYKFLPLVQHAAKNFPYAKWYIYMEDDNYYFWPQLYTWLSTFDASQPLYLGSPAFRLGEDFAHGGSGFAISAGAMAQTFGADPDLASKNEDYARERCCGDQVLSHVMASKGVQRHKDLDGTGWQGLQSLPVWRMNFAGWNWCSPVLNVHKVHQEDVSKLWEFERAFRAANERGGEDGDGDGDERKVAVIRYRDLFEYFVMPSLEREAERIEWDNFASAKTFSSSQDQADGVKLEGMSEEERSTRPWFDKEACKRACEAWEECLSWRYADDNCGLASAISWGHRINEGILMESGWMMGERFDKLRGKKCDGGF
ncbi:hypothetical protein MMC25_000824 [Agyrium rufum]|nr:hypothetical protein [Agyrium rufum]